MKVGDPLVVNMEGFEVCYATIESIDDETVTVFIPATRVVLGVKKTFTDLDSNTGQELLGRAEKPIITPKEKDYEDSADQPVANEAVSSNIKPEDISAEGLRGMVLDSSAID